MLLHEICEVVEVTIAAVFNRLVFEAARRKVDGREAFDLEVFMRIVCCGVEFGENKLFFGFQTLCEIHIL